MLIVHYCVISRSLLQYVGAIIPCPTTLYIIPEIKTVFNHILTPPGLGLTVVFPSMI